MAHDPQVVDRFCAYIRALRTGDTAAFCRLVQAMGATTLHEDGVLIVTYPGLTVGIPLAMDVTACCAQTALALFGPQWGLLPWLPTAWNRLHAEARAEARARRQARTQEATHA